MNFRYPVFLDLTAKKCLVTGEGNELTKKIKNLMDCGAHVIYVNPRAEAAIGSLAVDGSIEWRQRELVESDFDDCFLAITDCEDNGPIFEHARNRHVLCNAVDDPEHCHFSFGSVHRQGDLTIAVSTNGWAPALAVRLKEWLQREVGPEFGELVEILKELRPMITQSVQDFDARKKLWYRIVDSDALARLRAQDRTEAREKISQMVAEAISSTSRSDISGGTSSQ